MAFGETLTESTVSEKVRRTLSEWLDNPPDYHDVKSSYKTYGSLKKAIRLLKRDIARVEDDVKRTVDKPRGNAAKNIIAESTADLNDKLAVLESELEEIESHVKFLEYAKSMYASASYQSKVMYE